MKYVSHAFASGAAFALALSAVPSIAQDRQDDAAVAAEAGEHDKLFALFADADERELKLNPVGALFRGDMRYADRLGDYLTDEYLAASKADNAKNIAMLAEIDRSKLSATDQLAYDVFAYNQQRTLAGFAPEILAVTQVRPINHFSGVSTRSIRTLPVDRARLRSRQLRITKTISNGTRTISRSPTGRSTGFAREWKPAF